MNWEKLNAQSSSNRSRSSLSLGKKSFTNRKSRWMFPSMDYSVFQSTQLSIKMPGLRGKFGIPSNDIMSYCRLVRNEISKYSCVGKRLRMVSQSLSKRRRGRGRRISSGRWVFHHCGYSNRRVPNFDTPCVLLLHELPPLCIQD